MPIGTGWAKIASGLPWGRTCGVKGPHSRPERSTFRPAMGSFQHEVDAQSQCAGAPWALPRDLDSQLPA